MLDGLVDKFGPQKVWDVGLEVLGFPPNLFPSVLQVLEIQQALEKGQ